MRRNPDTRSTRRDFLVRAAYVAPAILTLPAVLSIASAGSGTASSGSGGSGTTWAAGSGTSWMASAGSGTSGTSGETSSASPPAGGGKDKDRDSCTAWWHIFFCFPPWKGNIF